MDKVNFKKNHFHNKSINDITNKIENWPKDPESIKTQSLYKHLLIVILIFTLTVMLSRLILEKSISEIINILSLLIFIFYYVILKIVYFRGQHKKYTFSIFKARLRMIKHDMQLELDFITWLQNYRIIDREFVCERLSANCNKHIKINNILLGSNATNFGLFSTVLAGAISATATLFSTNLNNPIIEIMQIFCIAIGAIYLVALMDLHTSSKMEYFIELIKKSIMLDNVSINNISSSEYLKAKVEKVDISHTL